MPSTITGSAVTTGSLIANSSVSTPTLSITGGNTLVAATTAAIRAWANVYTANTSVCSFNGFNIASVSLVATGRWDVTFTNVGYINTNSIVVLMTLDNNYNITAGYDRSNSTLSKVRLACNVNTGTAYTVGWYTVIAMW